MPQYSVVISPVGFPGNKVIASQLSDSELFQGVFKDLDLSLTLLASASLVDNVYPNVEERLQQYFFANPKEVEMAINNILVVLREKYVLKRYECAVSNISRGYEFEGLISQMRTHLKLTELQLKECEEAYQSASNSGFKESAKKQVETLRKYLNAKEVSLNSLQEAQNSFSKLVAQRNSIDDLIKKNEDIVSFMLNFLLNINIHLCLINASMNFFESYLKILESVADFIYHFGREFFHDDAKEQYSYVLLFYIIAGVDDSNVYKKACYLNLIEILFKNKIQPSVFDLLDYCQEFPEQFIELFKFLIAEDPVSNNNNENKFSNNLNLLIQNHHVNAEFEKVKLQFFLSLSYMKTGALNKSDRYKSLALSALLKLLKDDLCPKAAEFLKMHFKDDFVALVYLAEHYFSRKHCKQAMPYLLSARQIAQSSASTDKSFTEAYELMVHMQAFESDLPEDRKSAVEFYCRKDKLSDGLVITYLKRLSSIDDKIAFQIGMIYKERFLQLESRTPNDYVQAKYFFEIAAKSNAEAYYLIYELDKAAGKKNTSALNESATRGYLPAIEEMKSLVGTSEDSNMIVQLGNLYLEGKVVPRDKKLAAQYFLQAHDDGFFLPKVELASLIVDGVIENTALDPVELLFEVMTSWITMTNLKAEAENRLRVLADKVGRYQYAATLALAKFYHNGIPPDFKENNDLSSGLQDVSPSNYRQAAMFYERCFAIDRTKALSLLVAFRSNHVRRFFVAETLSEIFTAIYESNKEVFCLYDYIVFVEDFLARKDKNLNMLVLMCDELRQPSSGEMIINLLEVAKTEAETDELIAVIAKLIAERNEPKVLEWLRNNENILLAFFDNVAALEMVENSKNWQKFIEEKQFLSKENSNNNRFSFLSFSSSSKKLTPSTVTKYALNCFVSKKLELYNTIFKAKANVEENIAKTESEGRPVDHTQIAKLTFLKNAIDRCGKINQPKLKAFIEELNKKDESILHLKK